MDKTNIKENKMGVMPEGRLLLGMSFPIMLSMLMQALYNVVDSIFVSRLGEDPLTAVSLAFPVQSLIIAVSVGTGVGINALLSRKLGEKNFKEASSSATNGYFLGLCSWVPFLIFGLFFSKSFFGMFTDSQNLINLGSQYLSICTVFSFGVFLQIVAERVLQGTGKTVYTMVMQGVGAVINIILDPILIFGLFGIPKMGVAGAAIATVIGQVVAMILGLVFNITKNKELDVTFKHFRPKWKTIKEIYRVGIPAIVMQSIMSVMTVGMNAILIMFSQTAVTIYGVYFKLQSFIYMPVFGLTNGLVPIVSYNYGAKKHDRIVRVTRLAIIYSAVIMLIGTLVFELFPQQLLGFFDATPQMYAIGIPALRIISTSFVFAAVGIVLSCVFQALGYPMLSLVMSVIRQLVIILPAAYILSKLWGLPAAWICFPLADFVSFLVSLVMFKYVYDHRLKKKKPQEQQSL